MRPRILYEVSQHLAILLEAGMRGGETSSRIPVFLCHPLDPQESGEELASRTVGILYPARISPDLRYRGTGMTIEPPGPGGRRERLRLPGLWVRIRFCFLVMGGSLEDQLLALECALGTLHDTPEVKLEEEAFPLRIVEDPDGWRDLGLAEHRLGVSFEVTVALPPGRFEDVDRILERAVHLEEDAR